MGDTTLHPIIFRRNGRRRRASISGAVDLVCYETGGESINPLLADIAEYLA